MTTAVRRRRGTTAQHATFTGLEGEISIDTTKDTVVVHDGTTAGGHPLAKENNTALTGNVTVTTNNSSPALTITQDGTGNALEVRDVTGDTTPFVVDASGRVLVGRTTSGLGASLEVQNDSANAHAVSFAVSNTIRPTNINVRFRAGATAVQSGDQLGVTEFRGFDGSNTIIAAAITSEVDGTPGTNDMPGRLVFSTTADGASSPTERMRIDNAGRVIVNQNGAAISGDAFSLGANGGGVDHYLALWGDQSGSNADFAGVRFYNNQANGSSATPKQVAGITAARDGNNYGGALVLSTAETTASAVTERMRIDSSGNVGIGVAPAYKVDVVANADAIGLNLRGRAADGISVLRIANNSNTETAAIDVRSSYVAFCQGSARTEFFRLDASGTATVRNSTGLGYGTGSGGTVTQATSKSTAVTLNKPSGQITMHNAALAAGASVSFTFNNSSIDSRDSVLLNSLWGAVDGTNYRVEVQMTGVGASVVRVTNISAGSLSDALVINFCVIKGTNS